MTIKQVEFKHGNMFVNNLMNMRFDLSIYYMFVM